MGKTEKGALIRTAVTGDAKGMLISGGDEKNRAVLDTAARRCRNNIGSS